MAKLHFVMKARKTIRGTGIKKGDSYFWYKHRRGPKVCSKDRPKRSAYSTTSPFIAGMMDLEDRYDDLAQESPSEEIADALDSLAEDVDALQTECESSVENVEQAFPNGCPTLELLEARVEACQTISEALRHAASEIRSIDFPSNGEEIDDHTHNDFSAAFNGVSWEYE